MASEVKEMCDKLQALAEKESSEGLSTLIIVVDREGDMSVAANNCVLCFRDALNNFIEDNRISHGNEKAH